MAVLGTSWLFFSRKLYSINSLILDNNLSKWVGRMGNINVERRQHLIDEAWYIIEVFCKNDFMKKDRQHNGQQKKNKRTNNDPQNITQQGKDRATRTPQKSGGERVFSGRNNISCSTCDTHAKNG